MTKSEKNLKTTMVSKWAVEVERRIREAGYTEPETANTLQCEDSCYAFEVQNDRVLVWVNGRPEEDIETMEELALFLPDAHAETVGRSQKARKLLSDAITGPSFIHGSRQREEWNLYSSTWIVPAILKLIPELNGVEIRGLISSCGMTVKG